MKTEDFDRAFDRGSDGIDAAIQWDQGVRPDLEVKRVNIDFPAWMVKALDREAQRLGIARQAIVKTWLAERIERVNQQGH